MRSRVSVVIPAHPADVPAAKKLAATLSWAYEVIIDTQNGGCARAKNRGAAKAKGDILFFLDADVESVIGDVSAFDTEDVDHWFPRILELTPSVTDLYSRLAVGVYNITVKSGFGWSSTMAVRRDAFMERGGFNEEATWEDMSFAMYCHRHVIRCGVLPLTVKMSRRFHPTWKYLLPGAPTTSRGKAAEPLGIAMEI